MDWVKHALAGNAVWGLGQLNFRSECALNQAVKRGELIKARVSWQFISPPKTVWYLPNREPIEVIAQNRLK